MASFQVFHIIIGDYGSPEGEQSSHRENTSDGAFDRLHTVM